MKTHDFYYDLPEELIAQTPIQQRDQSRMMKLDRTSGGIEHLHFYDLVDQLRPGDCLILNNSRVLPARLYGIKEGTGARVEFLLLSQKKGDQWEVLAGPGKKAKPGSSFVFGDGLLRAQVLEVIEGGNRIVEFSYEGNFYEVLDRIGQMPLPHYITERLEDKERYQTVYSKEPGSAAAPTAGLHFTPELLQTIQEKGISVGFVTLHVGLGTFRPVKVDEITEHKMHAEHYEVSEETAALINETKAKGGRVIAVGTTSCRTLESVMAKEGEMKACEGWTDIFIYPGFSFRILDGLITNFHLPESTLIMLVSAFAGYDHTMRAYQTAVQERYRFFSFGDAMLVV
ncbi:MAG: tRNA preQ1(34) S-adenosylmethionine ribosyltransferase-isomerase QueA [Clostridiales bacterium]|jgi:S-adenosylmethionine:tRNA ribosyltransferase-isomerase|nr:tRNA preQ1(34) S-adenosylmethionine ribosyltransferase-isomerase QueA [Clostridiales bacterium]